MTKFHPRSRRLPSALVLGPLSGILCGLVQACSPEDVAGNEAREAICAGGDLKLAPPPIDVDGLRAVPIDIQRVDASVVLDATAHTAQAEVAMHFRMGAMDGYPIFDLRQTIAGATLNGASVSPAQMAHHGLGGGEGAEMRVLEVSLPACSDNTLALSYAIDQPSSPLSRPIGWGPGTGRVSWDFWLSDLHPGRYLEMWFPANLIYDRFTFTLDLELRGSALGHTLITNGAVDHLSGTHWRVTYPLAFRALSPMLLLLPDDRVDAYTTRLRLEDGSTLDLDLFKDRDIPDDLPALAGDIGRYVEEFTMSTGRYPYARLTGYFWQVMDRSMEYDGGFTSNIPSLKHEVFHGWWGRGVEAASQDDGWIDEAWDVYNTDPSVAFAAAPLDPDAPPVTLSPANPWSRITPLASYTDGPRLFAGIAALIGPDRLRDAMKVFYERHALELVTTQELERHLYCTSTNAGVLQAFHRFVYGRPGTAPAPEPGYCQ
jgi:hypothetical protein